MSPKDKAQQGLASIQEAILMLLSQHKDGLPNSEIARALGLESDFQGSQKNYLSWSAIGLLVNQGKIIYEQPKHQKIYRLPKIND